MELDAGNSVIRIDEPAGTLCPLAVVMKNPLNRNRLSTVARGIPTIFWHENGDRHYEMNGMGGYASKASGQFLYGPLTPSIHL
jgi:hypothetical protein